MVVLALTDEFETGTCFRLIKRSSAHTDERPIVRRKSSLKTPTLRGESMPPTVHRFASTDIAGIRYHGIMEGFIREPCIATFRFIALYVQAGRRSIYQNGTCSIRSEMAAKHPQTSIPREQMDGVSQKGKSADGKITMGGGFGCLGVSLPIVRRLVKNAH